MFSPQEKELLLKLLSEFRVNPLAGDAVAIIQLIQSAARKVLESTEPRDEVLHKKEK